MIRRISRVTVGFLLGLAFLGMGPVPAWADTPPNLGELTFYPGTGRDTDPMFGITSGPCPAAATSVVADIYGKGFPAGGQVVVPNGPANLSRTERFFEPFQDTLNGFAALYSAKLSGPYTVVLKCQDKFGQKVYGTFTGVITFHDATHYTAKETKLIQPSPEPSGGASQPATSGSTGAATPGSTWGGSAPAGTGQPSGPAASSTPLSVAGGDTNTPPAMALTNLTDGGASHWVLFGLGLLLALLGVGMVVRGRLARPTGAPEEPADDRVDEHV